MVRTSQLNCCLCGIDAARKHCAVGHGAAGKVDEVYVYWCTVCCKPCSCSRQSLEASVNVVMSHLYSTQCKESKTILIRLLWDSTPLAGSPIFLFELCILLTFSWVCVASGCFWSYPQAPVMIAKRHRLSFLSETLHKIGLHISLRFPRLAWPERQHHDGAWLIQTQTLGRIAATVMFNCEFGLVVGSP